MDQTSIPLRGLTKKRKSKRKFMKILLITFWGLLLCLNTWTESLEKLIDFQSLGFKWNPSPDLLSFFYIYDLTLVHPDFVVVKLGHFLGFAVMDFLLFNLLKSHKGSIGISIIFAFFTEFLQLYFGRDGRLYDFAIDALGVVFVYVVIKLFRVGQRK